MKVPSKNESMASEVTARESLEMIIESQGES